MMATHGHRWPFMLFTPAVHALHTGHSCSCSVRSWLQGVDAIGGRVMAIALEQQLGAWLEGAHATARRCQPSACKCSPRRPPPLPTGAVDEAARFGTGERAAVLQRKLNGIAARFGLQVRGSLIASDGSLIAYDCVPHLGLQVRGPLVASDGR